MFADIVERPQFSVAVPDDSDGLAGNFDCQIAAGFANLFYVANPLPCPGKDSLYIDLIPLFLSVRVCAQRQGFPGNLRVTGSNVPKVLLRWKLTHDCLLDCKYASTACASFVVECLNILT